MQRNSLRYLNTIVDHTCGDLVGLPVSIDSEIFIIKRKRGCPLRSILKVIDNDDNVLIEQTETELIFYDDDEIWSN